MRALVRIAVIVLLRVLCGVLVSVGLLVGVITMASPVVWTGPQEGPGETGAPARPTTASKSAEDLKNRIFEWLEKLSSKEVPGQSVPSPGWRYAKDRLSALLKAAHLEEAPAGMRVMYVVLLLTMFGGTVCAMSHAWKGAEFAAYALPFLGVAGVLMSFLILASATDQGPRPLREVFIETLSYAAFTTIYGIFGSLSLELWILVAKRMQGSEGDEPAH